MYDERVMPHVTTCAWPRLYYGLVDELVREIDARSVVEVGIAYGFHLRHLLDTHAGIRTYVGIDPYLADYDPKDCFCGEVQRLLGAASGQAGMDALHGAVAGMAARRYGCRANVLRATTAEVAPTVAPGSVDLVFVDGSHRYEAVLDDLRGWWPALRTGGILCGDDYNWADVARAAKVFAAEVGCALRVHYDPRVRYPIFSIVKR